MLIRYRGPGVQQTREIKESDAIVWTILFLLTPGVNGVNILNSTPNF